MRNSCGRRGRRWGCTSWHDPAQGPQTLFRGCCRGGIIGRPGTFAQQRIEKIRGEGNFAERPRRSTGGPDSEAFPTSPGFTPSTLPRYRCRSAGTALSAELPRTKSCRISQATTNSTFRTTVTKIREAGSGNPRIPSKRIGSGNSRGIGPALRRSGRSIRRPSMRSLSHSRRKRFRKVVENHRPVTATPEHGEYDGGDYSGGGRNAYQSSNHFSPVSFKIPMARRITLSTG